MQRPSKQRHRHEFGHANLPPNRLHMTPPISNSAEGTSDVGIQPPDLNPLTPPPLEAHMRTVRIPNYTLLFPLFHANQRHPRPVFEHQNMAGKPHGFVEVSFLTARRTTVAPPPSAKRRPKCSSGGGGGRRVRRKRGRGRSRRRPWGCRGGPEWM